jgi:hypothetical protein
MPQLSTSNCLDVLEVYSVEDNSTDLTDEMTAQDMQPTPTSPTTANIQVFGVKYILHAIS